MRGSTFLLRSSNSDCRNVGKISIFSLSPLSLSLYLFSSSFSLPVCFSSSLIQCTPPFVCSPSYFLFFFFFSFLSFSHLFLFSFLFIFSFFFSSLTFLFLLLIFFPQPNLSKWGKLPLPYFPLSHLSSPCIFLIFLYFFSFFFITTFNTWLNVSHLFQVYHMAHAMCHFPRVSCGITWSCHVLPDTWCLEKCEISNVLDSNAIQRGN